MTDLLPRQQQALEPLRQALLAGAAAEADRLRGDARREGAQAVAQARAEAEAVLEAARAKGESDGAELLAAEQTAAHRAARAAVLLAQHTAYEELRRRALEAVGKLLQEPERRSLLAALLRDRLGGVATVSDTADGGLFAQAPDGRSIDSSVSALVDSALAGLHLEQLWTPG
jgi:vacuolar-type H+-ATPase subunit E/Vma4